MTSIHPAVAPSKARGSRANADVLADTHSIGGGPAKGEAYGWASWSKRKGILAIRNPDDQPAKLALDLGKAFELPADSTRRKSRRGWRSRANNEHVQHDDPTGGAA